MCKGQEARKSLAAGVCEAGENRWELKSKSQMITVNRSDSYIYLYKVFEDILAGLCYVLAYVKKQNRILRRLRMQVES